MFKGFIYKKGVFKCNLIMEFKHIKILKEGQYVHPFFRKTCAMLFFCKINSLFVELKFCAQTKEEEYKYDSNIAW